MGPSIPTHRQVLGTLFLGSSGTKVAKAIDRTENAPDIDPDLPLTFMAVDLLAIDDQPLLDVPLLERKRILETAFEEADLVRRSAFIRPPIGTFLVSWRAFGFVEIAYKSANSRYTPGQPNPRLGRRHDPDPLTATARHSPATRRGTPRPEHPGASARAVVG